MLLREVVEERHDCVGPLLCVAGFVDEVVDLPGDGFTKNPLLRGVRKYIGGVVHLLCHVEGVVDDRGQGAGYTPR